MIQSIKAILRSKHEKQFDFSCDTGNKIDMSRIIYTCEHNSMNLADWS